MLYLQLDGSTVPFFMQTSLIRRNLVDSSSSDLLIIFLILAITAILIACIIGCIVLYKVCIVLMRENYNNLYCFSKRRGEHMVGFLISI